MRKDFNVVVGIDHCGDAIVLDNVFEHENNFKGAVGSCFRAVCKAEYRERLLRKAIVQTLLECDVCKTERRAIEMYQQMKLTGELNDFVFDSSYANMHGMLREKLNWTEKKYPAIECTGGGRCFSAESLAGMEKIICEPEIIAAIKEAEGIQ